MSYVQQKYLLKAISDKYGCLSHIRSLLYYVQCATDMTLLGVPGPYIMYSGIYICGALLEIIDRPILSVPGKLY